MEPDDFIGKKVVILHGCTDWMKAHGVYPWEDDTTSVDGIYGVVKTYNPGLFGDDEWNHFEIDFGQPEMNSIGIHPKFVNLAFEQ